MEINDWQIEGRIDMMSGALTPDLLLAVYHLIQNT